MYAVGTFETGLATRMRITLQLDAMQLGLLYAACALFMLIAQIFFFSSRFKDFADRKLITPAIVAIILALILFPTARSTAMLTGIVAVIASSAGIITPLISHRLSQITMQQKFGKTFGLHTAASSLGQAAGSAGSNVLLSVNQTFPFWIAALILLIGSTFIFFKLPTGSEFEAN